MSEESRGGAPPRRLSYDDLATLNNALVDLVRSRVPLPGGLSAWASELGSGRLASVLDGIKKEVEAGQSLSDAIGEQGGALPPIYRALVAAGEASGDLPAVLAILAEQAEVDAEIARRARDTIAYPAITLGAAVLGAGTLSTLIVPQFKEIFDNMGVELPAITELVLSVSAVLHARGAAGFVVFLVLALGVYALFTRVLPRFAPALVGGATIRGLAELSRALGAFLKRGTPADKAFRALAEAHQDATTRAALASVATRLEQGGKIADALRPEKAFPPTFTWLVGTAEQRGTLPETLADLALQYERSFRRRLKLVEALVAPLLLIVVGCIIATCVLAVFLPIFKLQAGL